MSQEIVLCNYFTTLGILREHFAEGYPAVLEMLPDRSIPSLKHRAKRLGLSAESNQWTEEEDRILKKYYPTEGKAVAKRLPKHTKSSVTSRAGTFGIRLEEGIRRKPWTDSELSDLRKYYPSEREKVAKRFHGRTLKAVKSKAYELKIKVKKQ